MQKKMNIYVLGIFLLLSNIDRIIAGDCTVTQIAGSPYITGISNPTSVAYSRNGKCLAVANFTTNTVAIFKVNSETCQLTPLGSPVSTGGSAPSSIAYSPTCKCLAVVNNASNDVTVFSVNQDTCEITRLGAPVPTGGVAPVSLAYSPDGKCLAVANEFSNPFPGTGSLSVFNVDPDTCAITLDGPPITSGVINPMNPTSVAYSPDGKCIALANFDVTGAPGTVSVYRKIPGGCSSVVMVGSFPTGGINPTSLSFSPNGKCLAVTNSDLLVAGIGSVTVYSVDPTTCELTPINTAVPTGGDTPINLSYSRDGKCLSVTNIFSENMTIFSVNSATCGISSSSLITVGTFPRDVEYSPDNSCIAVANSGFNPLIGPVGPTGSISIFENNILERSDLVKAIFAKYCLTCLN